MKTKMAQKLINTLALSNLDVEWTVASFWFRISKCSAVSLFLCGSLSELRAHSLGWALSPIIWALGSIIEFKILGQKWLPIFLNEKFIHGRLNRLPLAISNIGDSLRMKSNILKTGSGLDFGQGQSQGLVHGSDMTSAIKL